MLEGKALIEDTDMPAKMQIQAMSFASQALDVYDVLDYKSIAAHIKKVTPTNRILVFGSQSVSNLDLVQGLVAERVISCKISTLH